MNGVPDGFYFLVTDITITSVAEPSTFDGGFYLHHHKDCDTGSVGGGNIVDGVTLRITPSAQTWTAHYQAPLFVASPHHCFSMVPAPFNTYNVDVVVTGYLTAEPYYFRY